MYSPGLDFLPQFRLQIFFFFTVPDHHQSYIGKLLREPFESASQKINPLQFCKPPHISENEVGFPPIKLITDTRRLRLEKVTIETCWQINDTITHKLTNLEESVPIGTNQLHLS